MTSFILVTVTKFQTFVMWFVSAVFVCSWRSCWHYELSVCLSVCLFGCDSC